MKKKGKTGAVEAQPEDAQQHNNHEEAESHTGNTAGDAASEEKTTGVIDEEVQNDTGGCQEKLAQLQKSLEECNDKFLRLFSEFDNYRKRVSKERIELTKTASESIITSLLPVLDDLERAAGMEAAMAGKEAEKEGVRLIFNKFKSTLRQKGVEEIAAIGEDFNTDYHDAITHIPATDKKQKGKVVEEVQKGYLLNGKVIRYARVVVAN